MEHHSFIDCSRLAKRISVSGLTGIDRVAQAYVNWLATQPIPSHFIKHSPTEISLFSKDEALAIHKQIEQPTTHKALKSTLQTWRKLPKHVSSKKLKKQLSGHKETLDKLDYQQLNNLTPSAYPNRFKTSKKLTKTLAAQKGIYFNICHSTLTHKSYLDYLSQFKQLKKIFFFHDTIPLDFPEYCRGLEDAKHKLRLIHLFEHADHIITNSEYTSVQLEYWRNKLSLPPKPITPIHIGVNTKYSNTTPSTTTQPYFVILGTIEPRKNHRLLIDIWKSFIETLPPEKIPQLKIIGKRGWEIEELCRILDRKKDLKPYIKEYHDLSDIELWPILKGSQALLFPSFVEGWGMPLVEALSIKVPAICSDIPSLREAGQNLPCYINTLKGDEWASTILDYASNHSSSREQQITRLNHFMPPTWEEHFKEVDNIIFSLLE